MSAARGRLSVQGVDVEILAHSSLKSAALVTDEAPTPGSEAASVRRRPRVGRTVPLGKNRRLASPSGLKTSRNHSELVFSACRNGRERLFRSARRLLALFPLTSGGGGGSRAGKRKKKKAKEKGQILEQIVSSKKQEEEKKRGLDKRTPAQVAYEKMQEKRQMERILKKASKTHKQRVEDFNRHLDTLTEHYDIPKVSWTK
ncbi:PREDICTED: protein FAM32A [Tinamus guttatus]|nr:PREDICTED: protein FAM32A [Tinamus guttatus]